MTVVNETDPFLLWLWAGLAALAGAASSLSFQPYKTMTWREIMLTLFVSASFAIFVGPPLAEAVAKWYGGGILSIRVYGAVMWFMGAAAFALIPATINRAKRFIAAWNGPEAGK